MPVSLATIVATAEPVIATALARASFGERLSPPQALGAALVLSAVLILNVGKGEGVVNLGSGTKSLTREP